MFRVRDVTDAADRLHGRKIGLGLIRLRNAAITLLRQYQYPYIPDAQRAVAARPNLTSALLETDILKSPSDKTFSTFYVSCVFSPKSGQVRFLRRFLRYQN